MSTTEVKKERTLTAEKAKEIRSRLPEFCCRLDDLCEEVGLGRKFPECQ